MFPLFKPSAVILVVGIQLSILGNINLEQLFYPIPLLGHAAYVHKESDRTSTANSKLNRQSIPTNDKKEPNRISVFDSSIPANHEAGQEDKTIPIQGLTLDTIAAYNDQAEHNNESHRITVFDFLVPSEQEENQDSKNIPVQGLTIPTDDDKSYENQESNRITVFHSSIPSEQEETQQNKIVPVEGLTIDSENDKSNQNQDSNKITVFESSIPTRYHEDQDRRKVSVQRLTIDKKQGGNYQKHKLDGISGFDASVKRKQEEVEESKDIPFHGLYIPKRYSNKMKPGIGLHHISISNSLSLRNEQQEKKDEDEDENAKDEDGEEQTETDEESVEEQSFFKTYIRAPYKQAYAQDSLNKGLQRISVFDSNILSKNNDEDEVNMQDIHNPVIVQNHRHELQNRRKEFHRITVFDSTPFSPESVPAIDQTLLRDRHSHENPEKGLRPIPISESSSPNNGKYQSYILDKDKPKHVTKIKNKKKQKKKSRKKKSKKKKSRKKISKENKSKNKQSKKKEGRFFIDPVTILTFGDNLVHVEDNSTAADALKRRVRVLCWIMTFPANHDTKAKHVKATWGKRCNKLLFMSTKEDSSLPTVKLPIVEGYNYLWGKTKAAFRYIHKHHFDDADWFLKADDDTYVIVENLRHMLATYDNNEPLYFGFRFQANFCPIQGYVSGGAGYVLSKKALDRFVSVGLPSSPLCKAEDTGAEDAEIGKCLERIGVVLGDSRDEYDRNRFFPFIPHDHVDSKIDVNFWYWKKLYYPIETGRDCCSEYAISFHYIAEHFMYVLEYFIYHLRPYGITYYFE